MTHTVARSINTLTRCLAFAIATASGVASGQQSTAGVSSAMQALGGMSPDQQQAILQRLGGQGGTLSPPLNSGYNPLGQNTGSSPTPTDQRGVLGNLAPAPPTIPRFFADDSLLLEINLPGEKTAAQLAADQYARELDAAALQELQVLNGQPMISRTASDLTQAAQMASAANAASAGNAAAQGTGLAALPPTSRAGATPGLAVSTPGGASTTAPLSTVDTQKLEDQAALIKVLRAGNPYTLDRDGVLQLPGFRAIELGGLTESEATRRLAAEPALQDFEVKVMRLPLTKTGIKGLAPYGYDLFAPGQQGLSPVISGAVPPDYIVGPDDVLEVQLYGNQDYSLELMVNRDGRINLPQLGPVAIGGKRFEAARREIENRVAQQMVGVHASVTMKQARTISVFVLGEAMYPGSYPITGLATVTSALFAAGGVKPQGSLRHIQVRRHGTLVREFDLYDLLMQGDSTADVNLLAGDVVMIPSVGPTVAIDGEVQRPAIYELREATSVAACIAMAGGFTPDADTAAASLVHVNPARQRVVFSLNPSSGSGGAQDVGNGDTLRVLRLRPQIDSGVTLQGYVYRPGVFAWHEGLKLTDVVGNVDELRPNADQNYVLIRRELTPGRRTAVLSADLAAALSEPESAANVLLQPRDTLTVFDLQTGRDRIIEPLMLELALQSSLQRPTEIVHVDGKVKVPGDYPLETGMRVSDLIRAGGNLESSAYGSHAELSRYTIEKGEQRRTQIMAIDLAAVARGDAAANVELQPFDQLSVKEISGWTENDQVMLTGEVRFPGSYTIKRGESLRSVIERAGGLTDAAFAEGSVFTREGLRLREQEQLDRLATRMQSDIASVSLMAARASQSGATAAYTVGQSLLAQIQATQAVGRLVIDLKSAIHATSGSVEDIELRDGDRLYVPKQRQDVMVVGEVQSASSHLFRPELARDDYIAQSGGTTRDADGSKIYVVRADGSVVANSNGWFHRNSNVEMRPGDAVVVPLDTERLPALPMWQSITQILYNIAIAAAAVHSF